jgi:hypothetical protein
MQIAPKNLFRYHGDGAQWNAGLGEIVYKKLGWRTAALIGDDYSFPWTSAAGIIADFCGIGGRITKRVWTPPAGGDYAPFIRQLPRPNQVDGSFWLVGGANTSAALTAFEQAYGPINAKQHSGNLFLYFLGANTTVAPRLVGAYMGGFGTFQTGGLKRAQPSTTCGTRTSGSWAAERQRRVLLQLLERRVGDIQGSTGRTARSALLSEGAAPARSSRASRSPTTAS